MTVPMTGARLRVLRESMGLTSSWLAHHLAVGERTIQRWENDVMRVPPGVAASMAVLVAFTDTQVAQLVADAPAVVYTYRSGIPAIPVAPESGLPLPAGWHRAVTARVILVLPDVVVRWMRSGSAPDSAPRGLRI